MNPKQTRTKVLLCRDAVLMHPSEAEKLAAEMTEAEKDDPRGWTYKARHCPNDQGYSMIDAYNKDGKLMGQY